MKIPINVRYKNRLIPNIILTAVSDRKAASLLVILDTGCQETIISYKDASLLQIPIKNLYTIKKIQGISGRFINLAKSNREIKLFLRDSENKSFKMNLDNIHISKESEGAGVTILGTDFLKQNNFIFVYNPNGESYLEKTE